jgi:NAD(P)-dependent dehydrogenase (short-subunit alcohol dehydrogenase family)
MASLEGRRALVTGGGTGLGYACAEQLLTAGARVTIAARRPDVLDAAVQRLATIGPPVDRVVCDITREEEVRAAVEHAAGGGNLDVLVANSGTGAVGAILHMDGDAWDQSFRTNVIGTAFCIKHAGLVMKEHGGGSIIAISSTSATKVQPWLVSYVVSKVGLDMLVRAAAIELSPHQIRVNCIQPGYIPTYAVSDQLHARLIRATPLGRPGSPADVGHAVTFLAGDEAGWITGQVFGVDGGLNIPVMPSMADLAERALGADEVRSIQIPDFTALDGPGV